MNNPKRYTRLLMALLMIVGMVSCTSETPDITYQGEDFVQFSDSTFDMPVTQDDRVFEVPVVFSTTSKVDRHVVVDVDIKNSNATEGHHFEVENRNLVVPAGELEARVRIRAQYNNVDHKDSLAFTLKVINHQEEQHSLYPAQTVVHLHKVKPFCIDDYVGDMLLTCTFPFSTSSTTTFLTRSERVNDSTLTVIAPFEESRNLTLRFHTGADDPFDRDIDVRTQIAFVDVNYGPVSMRSVPGAPSYYMPWDRAFVLYLLAELEHMGAFGQYYYIFQWITPDEAAARKNGLPTLY